MQFEDQILIYIGNSEQVVNVISSYLDKGKPVRADYSLCIQTIVEIM